MELLPGDEKSIIMMEMRWPEIIQPLYGFRQTGGGHDLL